MRTFDITRSTFREFVNAVDGEYKEYEQKQILEFKDNETTLVHDPDEETIEITRYEDYGLSIKATLPVGQCEISQMPDDHNLLTMLSTTDATASAFTRTARKPATAQTGDQDGGRRVPGYGDHR
jgi:hypothetical protein